MAGTVDIRTARRPEARRGTRTVWKVFGRNRGAIIGTSLLLVWVGASLLAPRVAPYDPLDLTGASRQPPSPAHLMGTDLLGRDVFSRIVYGARISLAIGLISVGIGLCVGATLGLVAGYYRGRADAAIMRLVDALLAFPGLLLALVVIAALRPGLANVMIAVGISSVPLYARLVRSLSLSIREQEYVQAARALGGSDRRVMFRHVVPNLIGPVIVLSTLQIGSAILIGSALSYLGMGAQPPTPEWGLMTVDGQAHLSNAWWISTFPGFAIFSVVMGFNLMGDGLRAALDPRAAQERMEV